MFDMRSYIVSLIAVFLALGIGILLGAVIVDKGILADQQNMVLKKIATQVNDLRTEKEVLLGKVSVSDQFMPKAASYIYRDRLLGKRVAVFCSSNITEQTRKNIQDTIRAAGGESILYVLNISDLTAASEETKENLRMLYEVDQLSDEQLEAIVVENFIEDISTWRDLGRIVALADSGWISIYGSFSEVPNAAIIVGEPKEKNRGIYTRLLAPMFKALEKAAIPIVAVEESESEYSNIKEFIKSKANATVDDIDLIPGQVAMIFALSGEYGNYGIKSNAQNFIPELTPLAPPASDTMQTPPAETESIPNDNTSD